MSTTVAIEAVNLAIQNKNYNILIVSPSERQSSIVFSKIKQLISGLFNTFEESATKIRLSSTGSSIYSLPNSPKTIRGFQADMVYLDEFAFFDNQDEILRAITPSISRGGRLTIISTPLGKNDKFFEFWNSNQFSKHKITWRECPHLNLDTIKEILDEVTFKREYECEFIDEETMLFPPALINKAVGDWDIPKGQQVYGIDVGRLHDETAIVGAIRSDNKIYVNYIKTLKNTPFDIQKDFILKLNGPIYIDATGLGMQLAEELKKFHKFYVESITISSNIKQEMMNNLRFYFDKELIKICKISEYEDLIEQLYSVQMEMKNTNIKYTVSSTSHHADKVMALALLVINKPRIKIFQKPFGL